MEEKLIKQDMFQKNLVDQAEILKKEAENQVALDAILNKNAQETTDIGFEKSMGLSPIEKLFNDKDAAISGNPLRQMGYDVFSNSASSAGMTGKYEGSYVLNVGEKVNINMTGDSVDVMALSGSSLLSPSIKGEVDSNGMLFVAGIGSVQAEGRTISTVEQALNSMASKKYKSIKIKLSISSGQDFTVFVYGHVSRPGRIVVGNNSSIIDALGAAGGVSKNGSLRNITYTSGKKSKSVDIYQAIFQGNDGNIILKANDKIFVNDIGSVVAIKNGVTQPGIYEIKDGETIYKLAVSYAGGFLPVVKGSEVTMTTYDSASKSYKAKPVEWSAIKSTKLSNGDTLQFRETYNIVENTVTIQGNIKHPNTYAYREGMRLSDILKSEDELLEETFLSQAVIRRVSGKDNTVETIPVYLKDFFDGKSDPLLQPKDVINIYKKTNSDFVDIYGCINTPKHLTFIDNMTLKDVMTDIQFMETDNSKTEDNKNEALYPQEDGTVIGSMENNSRLLPAESVAVEITNKNGSTQLYYLYDIMINSDRISGIELKPNDRILFRPLRGNEILKTVKVSGFVKNPGVFKFIDGKRLTDMIEMAGGVTEDADIRGTVFKRRSLKNKQAEVAIKNNERDIKLMEGRMVAQYGATSDGAEARLAVINTMKDEQKDIGKKYNGQISLNIKVNDVNKINKINNLYVQDGDDIYIPRIPNYVNVIGEVYNEMAFVYQKGARAKKYIKEIGGYTPNANRFKLYRISINGSAERIRKSSRIEPGDSIVVPRKVAGNEWIDPISKALASVANVAIAVMAVWNVGRR